MIRDWFERLMGFAEGGYEDSLSRLEVEGGELRSRVNGRSYGIGELELVSLQTLRERVFSGTALQGRLKLRAVSGDVRHLHQSPEYAGALFQGGFTIQPSGNGFA